MFASPIRRRGPAICSGEDRPLDGRQRRRLGQLADLGVVDALRVDARRTWPRERSMLSMNQRLP
jgi:hypothetical protein